MPLAPTIYKDFDARTVPLEGNNLIEASAGTGKTYSIALLVLRLIIEKGIPLREILMVTFTTAAVAELETRIRKFIRQANDYLSRGTNMSATAGITSIIDRNIGPNDEEKTKIVKQRLKDSLLLLDESNIMTIHSFCQQTMSEFAFESNQMMDMELTKDKKEILSQIQRKFWRKYVTTLTVELLQRLGISDTFWNKIAQAVSAVSDGKIYWNYQPATVYTIASLQDGSALRQLEKKEAEITALKERITEMIHSDQYMQWLQHISSAATRDNWAKYAEDTDLFLKNSNKATAKIRSVAPPEFIDLLNEYFQLTNNTAAELTKNWQEQLLYFAVQEILKEYQSYKTQRRLLTYDDLIVNLHRAVLPDGKKNERLCARLQEKFSAVFIDEFQDTDREQYEIFKAAFLESDTLSFLIGDPKQSIYGFRKADLFTYNQAKNAIGENIYFMNTNFRSSVPMIDAMNHFFLPTPDFDTFAVAGEMMEIPYFNVQSPENDSKGTLVLDEKPQTGMTLHTYAKEEVSPLALQVLDLLTNPHYRICKKEENDALSEKTVTPSDIGILVPKNKQGKKIKEDLAALGIPAVMIQEDYIFSTVEAGDLYIVLDAIISTDLSAVFKSLLTVFLAYKSSQLHRIDSEKIIDIFARLKSVWTEKGIYPALTAFIWELDVQGRLAKEVRKERILTNLFQLMEVLNAAQKKYGFSPTDLLLWFKKNISKPTAEDEYLQRIESDENAVVISTIHKSKGLQYNIVLIDHLDYEEKLPRAGGSISFRDPLLSAYKELPVEAATTEEKQRYLRQERQNFRRLLYVAVTRAVYKCYLFHQDKEDKKTSDLSLFLHAVNTATDPYINFEQGPVTPHQSYFKSPGMQPTQPERRAFHFRLEHPYWYKVSYSRISAHGTPSVKEKLTDITAVDDYEKFIFKDLKFGKMTGNLLHGILEQIDFRKEDKWMPVIEELSLQYFPRHESEFPAQIALMLKHILQANIRFGNTVIQLKNIGKEQRLSELEFDFPLQPFVLKKLQTFGAADKEISVKNLTDIRHQEVKEIEGLMNGKIDLLFRYGNKYFILDWKSNYLGYRQQHYSESAVDAAMNENNYHLQYLIYTVAVKKYLELRLPDFDYDTHFGGVIYAFVRGLRANSSDGIFRTRPSLEKINKLEKILTS